MANAAGAALCTSAKVELLQAIHNFGTTVTRASTAADTLKAALYLTTGNLGAATTSYSATSEVSGNNYAAGGVIVGNSTPPQISNGTAWWTPSAIVFSQVTLPTPFDTVLLYNASQGNRAILAFNFGSTTVNGGLTLNFPSTPDRALIILA